jgi:bifunctional DNA-binding transcriptional regulator/antitoxin component of YhaV-PrlF toxin-antitoxin module
MESSMEMVTVNEEYQVLIPQSLCEQIGLHVGDELEAKVERGKITLTRKSLVHQAIVEGLEDIRKGRVYGPFSTVDEMLVSLKGAKGKPARKARRGR